MIASEVARNRVRKRNTGEWRDPRGLVASGPSSHTGSMTSPPWLRTTPRFLVGQLLLEVSAHGAELSPEDAIVGTDRAEVDLSKYPHLQRPQAFLSDDRSTAEFEQMLEAILARLELHTSRRT